LLRFGRQRQEFGVEGAGSRKRNESVSLGGKSTRIWKGTYDTVLLGTLSFALDHVTNQVRFGGERTGETDEIDGSLFECVVHRVLRTETTSDAKLGVLEARSDVISEL
jgi:hypothetical protein